MRSSFMLAAASMLLASEQLATPAQPLSITEMQQTIGGVYAVSFDFPPSDNSSQPQDNLQFRLTVQNPFGQAVAAGIFEGSTKYAAGTITTVNNAVESLRMRSTNWPIDSVKRDVNLRYYDTTNSIWANATGAYIRNDVFLPSGLKVARVRFYHLQETGGTNPTSVGHSLVGLLDSSEYTYNWQDTAATDAITQQCAGDKRWQFRYHTVTTETVPTGCTTIRTGRGCGGTGQSACPAGTGVGDLCQNIESVVDNMIAARASADGTNAADYVHVVFFNSFQRWNSGSSSYNGSIRGTAPSGKRYVLVHDNLDAWGMSKTLTHEIGHQQGLCHFNDTGCSQYSASNDCADPERDRNLMCSSSGRELLTSQCNTLSSSTRFRDWL
jgi:hypothetical protein